MFLIKSTTKGHGLYLVLEKCSDILSYTSYTCYFSIFEGIFTFFYLRISFFNYILSGITLKVELKYLIK